MLCSGTIMDATLIASSSSLTSKAGKGYPEIAHKKNGNQWHFGTKMRVGVDARSGLLHTAPDQSVAP